MKLEIKHLAAYLPYKLQIQNGWGDIKTLNYTHLDDENNGFIAGVRLILVPLGELLYFSNGLRKLGYKVDTDNDIQNIIDDIEQGKAEYDIMEMCFEEHIDCFGLMDAGLAIDKNTLKNKK